MPWSITGARGALFLYLLVVPWLPGLMSLRTGHDLARALQMLLWLAAGLALWRRAGAPSSRGAALALALLLAALALVGLAPQPGWAALELAQWVGMVVVALLVADLVRADGRWREALGWTLLAASALQGGLEVLMAVLGLLGGIAPRPDLLGQGYDNLRFLNHVQTLSLPLTLVGLAWAGDTPPARRLATLALACGGAVLWASGGRATELALLLALALVAAVGRPARALLARRLLPGLLLSVGVYALVWRAAPALLGLASDGVAAGRLVSSVNDQARLTLWHAAWQQWLGHPWWGIGPMHLAAQPSRYAMHPHQLPLQLLAEWGAVVVLALLTVLGVWLRQRWRAWQAALATGPALAFTASLWAVLASLVDAQFSGNAVMPVSQVWLALAWGALMGAGEAPARPAASAWMAACTRGLVLALLAGAAVLTSAQWPTLDERLKQSLADGQAPRTQPRFWSHGRLTPLWPAPGAQ
ncbi:O-antigen ligase family protein [Ideonella sp. 4Y16]|uniref:O-antigen ligase family protein n=1 Tax=Ideonella alba TaxID=2824118 RepID=UPI001B35D069|nr:O-antigen ligase family protein [Ideonella alba]MBQ0943512.1 O-antigen ligase family protein [Ideonella alba]